MTFEPQTRAQERYLDALREAATTVEQLAADGRDDRAAGLAVGVDIGVSAAFLFQINDHAYEDAARVIRGMIKHAQRSDD